MGKRELLLIAGFVLAAAIVYQAAAPPPAPGERSFSWSQVVDHFRRGLRANRASVEITNTTRHPVDAAATELRLKSRNGALTIIGEDRPDIEAELLVRSNGEDAGEARRLAEATHFEIERTGPGLTARIAYPDPGTQRTLRLTLKVPARLRVILEESGSPLTVSGVAALDLPASRGEVRIRDVAGAVTGTHRGGNLTIADSGPLHLEINGADVRLQRVSGDVALRIRGAELRAGEIDGAVEIDAQGCDVTLDRLRKTRGPVRVTAVAGSLTVGGLRTEGSFDARNTDVRVEAGAAAPLTIRSEGGGSIEVTPAAGGYELDAATSGGDLALPEHTLTPTVEGQDHRAAGPVGGGGPLLRIHSDKADIVIHAR